MMYRTPFSRAALLLAFLFILAASAQSIASDKTPGALPELIAPGAWEVQPRADDSATLTENDGVLSLAYKVDMNEPFQHGHVSFYQSLVRLKLKTPLPLSSDIKRVAFEAHGMRTKTKAGDMVMFLPLVQDEKGEILTYASMKADHLKSGTGNWSGWMTPSFYSSEAGGASYEVFSATGGDGNAWPDGKLTLIGFDLAVRGQKPAPRQGTVTLGSVALLGSQLTDEDPFLFADALLEKAGDYRLGVQLFRRFQDAPVREYVEDLPFDPAKPSSARRKITFRLDGNDNYWIRYELRTADGKLVSADSMRAWLENRATAVSAAPVKSNPPVDLTQAPSVGFLRINPGHASCGVYQPQEKTALTVRAFGKGQSGYVLKWKVTPFAFDETILSGSEPLAFRGGKPHDVKLALNLPNDGDAFRFTAEVLQGEGTDAAILDRQEYILGRTTDRNMRYANRNGQRILRDQVKESAYVRVSYLPYKDGKGAASENADAAVERFSTALKEISQVTTNVTYMVDTVNFEILPGVFDFRLLDRIMDAAYDQNCRLTIRLSHADHSGIYRWQRYWPQRNFDGRPNPGKDYYGSFSITDRGYIDTFLNGFKALHDRYQNHPAFQGYQLFEIAGEWAVLDQPWSGFIVGYEATSQPAFVKFLQERVTKDIAVLNKRWGTAFRSWDDVVQPQPVLETGGTPDIRMQWIDFCQFKLYLDNEYWFTTAADSIRSYDPGSVLIIYSLDPNGFTIDDGLSKIDYLHNGGNHFLRGEGSLVDAWKKKVGWITEPHMPHRWAAYGDEGSRGWLLDWTTYIMFAQAGGGGANMHIYYYPIAGKEGLSLAAHYGREYAFDRFEQWKPLLRELHGLELQQPKTEVAAMQDIYTLFCKHRTIFQQRMDDLKRWFELLKTDSVQYEDYRADHAGDYKLILPNILDEAMSEENILRVAGHIRKGGKAVIGASTGRYCPERADTPFALLRELGITPPTKPFTVTDNDVTATVTADNPFFAANAQVAFYSLADMKRDANKEEVMKRFWEWSYRWIPQTDYFGYFPGHTASGGKVLAAFPDGGAAVTLHSVEKGEVLVFWGTPDYDPAKLAGFMQNVADWAGVINPRKGNPVPLTLEGNHASLNRHYAIMYQGTPGTYRQKLPGVPDGEFFVDDMVLGQRLGVYTAEELRSGVELSWIAGQSPLKALRMIPLKEMGARWEKLYRLPPEKK